jgi:methyl-accepting chemotaxis protein
MDQSILIVLTIFVAIAAIALIIQVGYLFGIYRAARAAQEAVQKVQPKVEALIPKVEAMLPKIEALIPKAESVMESSRQMIEETRKHVQELSTKANEIASKAHEIASKASEIASKASDLMDTAKKEAVRVDEFLEDATLRARAQLDRAEAVLDDAMGRIHQTVAVVHGGILRPLHQVQGVAAGFRTAVAMLLRGRPNPAEAHADEEMFI